MFFAALLVALQVAAVQPPVNETTDVDENTTPAEASPLAPSKAAVPAPVEAAAPGRSLDDILSAVRPVETPEEPKVPEEAPRAGLILATPAGSSTAVTPTFIDDRNARPDGPPSDGDILYETRILGAFRAAQGRQGPLDGRWLVARPGGEVLYSLQFADPGGGSDRIEGAWRNMNAQGLGGSGFIDTVSREDADVVVRFRDTATGRPEVVRIRQTSDGGWMGELTGVGRVPVVLSRDVSVELAAQGAPIYIPPPPPPPRPATTCKRVKSKGKWKTVCTKVSAKKGKAAKGKASSKKGSAKKASSKKSSSKAKAPAKKPTAKKK